MAEFGKDLGRDAGEPVGNTGALPHEVNRQERLLPADEDRAGGSARPSRPPAAVAHRRPARLSSIEEESVLLCPALEKLLAYTQGMKSWITRYGNVGTETGR